MTVELERATFFPREEDFSPSKLRPDSTVALDAWLERICPEEYLILVERYSRLQEALRRSQTEPDKNRLSVSEPTAELTEGQLLASDCCQLTLDQLGVE